uniref:Putative head maturation protease n=1 Tax=viral metagenome TaxID=1070528 RepID=A0A6M3LBJ2_9ZZZZ
MQDTKTISFTTDELEFGLKSSGIPYITGYISTDEIDTNNDMVATEAIDDLIHQLKSRSVKIDLNHEKFRDSETGEIYTAPQNLMPLGKIIDAEKVTFNGKNKIKITAELNKEYPNFKSIWKSIKGKFLDAFSIAYDVLDYAREEINGRVVTVLKSLYLKNVGLTGDAVDSDPINRGCTMLQAFMKSTTRLKSYDELEKNLEKIWAAIDELKNPLEEKKQGLASCGKPKEKNTKSEQKKRGGINMSEEEQPKEDAPVEKPAEAPKVDAPVVKDAPVEKPTEDGLKSMKSEIDSLKSLVKKQTEEIEKLNKILDKPNLKSGMQTDGVKSQESVKDISPLNLVR